MFKYFMPGKSGQNLVNYILYEDYETEIKLNLQISSFKMFGMLTTGDNSKLVF